MTYTYSGTDRPAIKDVDLTIPEGELVILTGPSGCGKTTLCRCMNGLIPHFFPGRLQGKITVGGLDTREHPVSEMSTLVGFVFQNAENQLFTLLVEKDVAFGPENLGLSRKEIRRRVDWALRMTGTRSLRYRAPHELSGGEKQRVAIASILAMKPKILVLDEPTSFVDPVTAKKIFEVVVNLNKRLSMSVIIVEHRLSLLAEYADRVIVMDRGEIVLDGSPEDVFIDDKAQTTGIKIPESIMLYRILGKEGILLPRIPLNPSTLVSDLRALASSARGSNDD